MLAVAFSLSSGALLVGVRLDFGNPFIDAASPLRFRANRAKNRGDSGQKISGFPGWRPDNPERFNNGMAVADRDASHVDWQMIELVPRQKQPFRRRHTVARVLHLNNTRVIGNLDTRNALTKNSADLVAGRLVYMGFDDPHIARSLRHNQSLQYPVASIEISDRTVRPTKQSRHFLIDAFRMRKHQIQHRIGRVSGCQCSPVQQKLISRHDARPGRSIRRLRQKQRLVQIVTRTRLVPGNPSAAVPAFRDLRGLGHQRTAEAFPVNDLELVGRHAGAEKNRNREHQR